MDLAHLKTKFAHHGKVLALDVDTLDTTQTPIVEGFLYEKSIHMIYADPGVGKSTIAIQIAAALTSGSKLFGQLAVPKQRNVYYIQMESSYEETIERMRLIKTAVPIDYSYLWIDDALKGVNVVKEDHANMVIERVRDNCLFPDLVIIDPIYAMVSGGLSKDDVASAFCRFSSLLQKELDCAVLHLHHTSKDVYASDGKKINRDNSFYGSQWLAAHPHNMFHLTKPDPKRHDRVTLYRKKSRNANLLPEIMLHFDAETHTTYIESDPKEMSGKEKVIHFLREFKEKKVWPSFYDIQDKAGVSQSHLRRILEGLALEGSLDSKRTEKGKKIYELTT